MADGTSIAEDRHTVMLRELAQMSFTLARDLQQRALQAETTEEAVKLASAFHKVTRGIRQSLALELKVIQYKDGVAKERFKTAEIDEIKRQAQADRIAHAMDQRHRQVWDRIDDTFSETEAPDWNIEDNEDTPRKRPRPGPEDPMWDKLETFMEDASAQPDFLTRDLDILIIEACDAIGADPTTIYDIRGREPREPASADTS